MNVNGVLKRFCIMEVTLRALDLLLETTVGTGLIMGLSDAATVAR
jgi:hypothetical protein